MVALRRDEWVETGYGDHFGLQACYWKQAFARRLQAFGPTGQTLFRNSKDAGHNTALVFFTSMGDPVIRVYALYQKEKDILQAWLRLSVQDSRHSAAITASPSERELTRAYI